MKRPADNAINAFIREHHRTRRRIPDRVTEHPEPATPQRPASENAQASDMNALIRRVAGVPVGGEHDDDGSDAA